MKLFRGVNRAPTHHGSQDLCAKVFTRLDFCQIFRKHYKVRKLAGLQLALLPFHEFAVSRTAGVSANAVVQRNFLLWLPAALWSAGRKFTRDARIQPAERCDRLDIVIRSKRQTNAEFLHGSPRVRTFYALRPNSLLGPTHVRGLVRWLHRSDHLQTRETREIGRRYNLRVFDAVAPVTWAVCFG